MSKLWLHEQQIAHHMSDGCILDLTGKTGQGTRQNHSGFNNQLLHICIQHKFYTTNMTTIEVLIGLQMVTHDAVQFFQQRLL